jgi:hypothetical protein
MEVRRLALQAALDRLTDEGESLARRDRREATDGSRTGSAP